MNYKKLFEESFSNVVPPIDSSTIKRKVLERMEKMETKKESIKGIRKPVAALAAAVATIAIGVTGAAAIGLISFNDIFGGEIKTEIEDSYVLMGRAENVKAYSSDDDYNISLLGVTGGYDCAIMSIEISRKDSKPIADFFTEESDDLDIVGLISTTVIGDSPDTRRRQSNNELINEKGNILVNVELSADYDLLEESTSLAGETITVSGDCFYSGNEFYDYFNENKLTYDYNGAAVQIIYKDGTPADLSSIESLPLNWGISFDYYPSEKSSVKLSLKEEDKNSLVTFRKKQMNYIDPNYPEIIEYSLEVIDIEIGSTNGFIDIIEYKDSKQKFPAYCFPDNEIYLITKSGDKVGIHSNGGVAYANAEHHVSREKLDYCIKYPEGESTRLAIDVSEIAAISINGEKFELVEK